MSLALDAPGPTPQRGAGAIGRWKALRDRLLGDPRFHRLAERIPGLRGRARREAAAAFDLCAGFVYSQILAACVRLDAFAALADGPLDADGLGRRIGLAPDAAERLARAAAALRLMEPRGPGLWGLGPLGAAMRADPGIAAMVRHHAALYADLADPVALLQGAAGPTRLAAFWPYAAGQVAAAEDVAAYSALMAVSLPAVAAQAFAAYPFRRHRRLLDLAGGEGRFVELAAAEAPALDLTVLDLPPVAARAEARLRAAGLAHRARAIGGDLLRDAPPAGADLVTLVRVLHDHDDPEALALLRAAAAALAPGGTVLVVEPMADAPGAPRVGDAYFGFYLLAMGRGRPRRPEELIRLAAAAGLDDARPLATPMPLLAGALRLRRRADRA